MQEVTCNSINQYNITNITRKTTMYYRKNITRLMSITKFEILSGYIVIINLLIQCLALNHHSKIEFLNISVIE